MADASTIRSKQQHKQNLIFLTVMKLWGSSLELRSL